ncbi:MULTISPECIES: hypothetical protein [unclassified Xanthobacter]|uniref:hypothetical protein n=1 Tax=unclassified Xanthobacter TaxID=2623496 RepID=UPI001F3AD470|nr:MULTISPECIES: hypothetical protein [unclassified Xanthobacter]
MPKTTFAANATTMPEAPTVSDLEPMVCDMVLTAGIASTLLEDAFDGDPKVRAGLTGGREDCYFLPSEHVEQLLFAAYHTQRLCQELKEAYYASLHASSKR